MADEARTLILLMLPRSVELRRMKRIANSTGSSSGTALRTVFVLTSALLAMSEFAGLIRAATLYWDTDASATGNNAFTGANLGGSGIWSSADTNWWSTSLGTLQVWNDGSDAVFWGSAGTVTASTVSTTGVLFKTTGYSVNSGTLAMTGTAAFNVDSNVTATINSAIAGTNTIWKLGPGTLVLVNTNNLNTANTVA